MASRVADRQESLCRQTQGLRESGLYKSERILRSPQGGLVRVADDTEAINLCANNYLGLSGHPELIEVARQALLDYGYGMSSVRVICGTQTQPMCVTGCLVPCPRLALADNH